MHCVSHSASTYKYSKYKGVDFSLMGPVRVLHHHNEAHTLVIIYSCTECADVHLLEHIDEFRVYD